MNNAYSDSRSLKSYDVRAWMAALDELPPRLRLRLDNARVPIDPSWFRDAIRAGRTLIELLALVERAEQRFVAEAALATWGADHPDAASCDETARGAEGH